jgi:uncharacterized protein
MQALESSLPLSPEQIEDVLARSGMNVDWATGFFAALHTGPDLVAPSDWVPHLTPEGGFADNQEAGATIATLLHLYGRVGKVMADNAGMLCPDPDDVDSIESWCSGYFLGSRLHPHWKDDRVAVAASIVFAVLGGEFPTEELKEPDGKPMSDVDGWLERHRRELRDHVRRMWDHWAPKRRASAEALRARGQIGRNDPCPCGSGKKYKKCCLG